MFSGRGLDIGQPAGEEYNRSQPQRHGPPIAATPQQGRNQHKHQPHHKKQEGQLLRKAQQEHPYSPPQPLRNNQEAELVRKDERHIQHNEQQHSTHGSDHPIPFSGPQSTHNQHFRQHPDHPQNTHTHHLHPDHPRHKKPYHRRSSHGMLDMEEMRLDEMILQTFEELENEFAFPLKSQREARAFTKELHNKGMTYKLIGSTVGESEHELAAWLGGQKNQQAGRMMIDRINLPLVELLSSDEEDEISATKKKKVPTATLR